MPVLTSSKLLTADQQNWPHQRTASTTRWPKTNKKMKNNEEKNKVVQKKIIKIIKKQGCPSQAQAGEVSGCQGQLGAGPGEASNGKLQRSGLTSSLSG